MCVAGKNTGAMRDWVMSTKVDTSRFRWRATSISGLWPDPLSLASCANLVLRAEEWRWSSLWQRCHPPGAERSLLVAGRSICQRIGSSGSIKPRCAGTGSALLERATRPPLWPAGMAEGNRETFGPRVGLLSHGSPAKADGGGAAQFNNIGPPRFPTRTCPAFRPGSAAVAKPGR